MEKTTIKLEITEAETQLEVKNANFVTLSIAVHLLMEHLAKLINKDIMKAYNLQKKSYKSFKKIKATEERKNVE